jgi:hypothetical protein
MAGRQKKSKTGKHPGGRPSIYDAKRFPDLAWSLATCGKTDAEIAAAFNIHCDTIYDWKKKYPEFSEALKNGKEFANAKVEKALYDSCFDHVIKEKRTTLRRNKETGKPEIIAVEEFEKVVPANILAQQTWLNNRKPECWRRNPMAVAESIEKDPLFALLAGIKDKQNDTADNRKPAVQEAD